MKDLLLVWDPRKAKQNLRKYGVSFAKAQTVFLDDHALLINDPDHSGDDHRFLMLGISSRLRVWWYVTAAVSLIT